MRCNVIGNERVICNRRGGGMKVSIREVTFIKDNMTRYNDLLSNKIETSITTMITRGTEINTSRGAMREFICSGCRCVGITETSKDAKGGNKRE